MPHRILSLDGGGAWAILQAMALKDLYNDASGHQILSNFDLAVANSGGSIVLAGLVEDMKPSEIYNLFFDDANRAEIFQKVSFLENPLGVIPILPKYSTSGKLAGLTRLLGAMGSRTLASFCGTDWPKSAAGDVRILIVALDYDELRAVFFRSYGTPHGATADDIPLVQAVHASSDAPVVFFDAPTQWGVHRYWDGAMAGLNNPLMAGIVDLMGQGVPANDITALSLGTGTVRLVPPEGRPAPPLGLGQPLVSPGVLTDLERSGGCITDDPPDMATFTAHSVLASARGADVTKVGPVVRMSPVIRPILSQGAWTVPSGLSLDQFTALTKLGMDAVEHDQIALLVALGTSWLTGDTANQPIRMNSADLSSSLGEDKYISAKKRWKGL